ncbi:MAG: GlsB/YeaQ/YmgE family stress response membrane protein [Mycobacteriales bacterium]
MFGEICTLLFVGAAIGAVARLVVPGYQPIGVLFTVLLGIVGAVGGSYLARALDLHGLVRWAIAVAISAVLVAIVTAAMRGGAGRHQNRYTKQPPRP